MFSYLAGKVWFYKVEGMPCLNGLNVYRKNDPSSAGFILKVSLLHFKVRYSKRVKKLFFGFYWRKPKETAYSI